MFDVNILMFYFIVVVVFLVNYCYHNALTTSRRVYLLVYTLLWSLYKSRDAFVRERFTRGLIAANKPFVSYLTSNFDQILLCYILYLFLYKCALHLQASFLFSWSLLMTFQAFGRSKTSETLCCIEGFPSQFAACHIRPLTEFSAVFFDWDNLVTHDTSQFGGRRREGAGC